MKRVVIDTNVLISSALSPEGPGVSDVSLPDEDDRIFYDTVKENEAILITGNTRHYLNESFIMTPSDFLTFLEENN